MNVKFDNDAALSAIAKEREENVKKSSCRLQDGVLYIEIQGGEVIPTRSDPAWEGYYIRVSQNLRIAWRRDSPGQWREIHQIGFGMFDRNRAYEINPRERATLEEAWKGEK